MDKDEYIEKLKASGDSIAIVDEQVLFYRGHVYKTKYDYYGEFAGLRTCCGHGGRTNTRTRADVLGVRDVLGREDICGNCERSLLSRTNFTVERVVLADDEEVSIEKS